MAKVKVTIDTGLCIGAANCVGTSADFFRLNEDNMATIRQGEGSDFEKLIDVSAAQLAILQEAAESCPTLAIQVAAE
jgi:ferredoxin